MVELFVFELTWPAGVIASGNPGVMMLSSTREDHALREAQELWKGQRETPVHPPEGYQVRETGSNTVVYEYRSDDE
jgi:hypothetical protein